jgi:uncharacterized protein YidB (DUF937 family)
MAGFDINQLLNQLMGKQAQPQQQQEGRSADQTQTQPQEQALMQQQAPQPANAMGAMPGGLVAGGGLAKLMDQLKGGGLGSQAKSWVSAEQPNQPVSGDQITQALGQDQIAQVADTLGMRHEQAAQTMATALPQVMDTMTPEGHLPEGQTESPQPPSHPQAGAAADGRPQ